jgi:hypothetical protein
MRNLIHAVVFSMIVACQSADRDAASGHAPSVIRVDFPTATSVAVLYLGTTTVVWVVE